jgi:hypothetical protein
VRLGCDSGTRLANTLADLVEDWVRRTICAAYHMALGTAMTRTDVTAWMRVGLEWLDGAGLRERSSRHTLSSLVCVCVL